MDTIKGLREYIGTAKYRKAMGLPEEVCEEYKLLAQGEYNMNYLFTHPVSRRKFLLRVNCESQMHLKNQIEYEYHALELLRDSGRTPDVFYVDGSLERLGHGVLVMEYLPGCALDYRKDMEAAARCLADIHSVPVSAADGLLCPKEPLRAILEECEDMVKVYMDSPLGNPETKDMIRRLLDEGWERLARTENCRGYRCCIITELNSTNFLINGGNEGNYLIDWEKPLYGEPAQDLGHFLAPTTTFWKTDVILTPQETGEFLEKYAEAVEGRFPVDGLRERVSTYIPITCLRGVTWCAMAWVQYQQPDKLIFNESTHKKLEAYLSHEFLKMLARDFFRIKADF